MKYKVGDKVRIKSLDWYNENKDETDDIECSNNIWFYREMSKFCGKVMTIFFVGVDYYTMAENLVSNWTDEMIEGLVEEETKPKFKIGDIVKWYNHTCNITSIDTYENAYIYLIKYDDYEEDATFAKWVPENELTFEDDMETKAEPKFKVGDSVEVLKSGNVYTISQIKFNGKEFVYTLSNNDSTVSCFSENELKPIHFIDIAIKPHNVRGDEVIKMLEELGGTNAFLFDGSDHNCVSPFAYYVNDDKQIYVGGTGFLRKNGYKIHDIEELKKKEYPKTYEECCYVLGFENTELVFEDDYRDINPPKEQWKRLGLINQFNKLLICRDAYWKIAGEEMGLGKDLSWVPDWMCLDPLYVILYQYHNIYKAKVNGGTSCILVFPTPEMRNAFYEAFKELIEECKELL